MINVGVSFVRFCVEFYALLGCQVSQLRWLSGLLPFACMVECSKDGAIDFAGGP
jgi:hypothetical protein